MLSDILNLHPEILSLSEFFSMQGLMSLLPGEITGVDYWKQLANRTRSMRIMSTPETAPTEFLYNETTGRFPLDNVPPLLISTLPHISDDPDALFDELAQIVPRFPKRTVERHHDALFNVLRERFGRQVWVERTGLSQMYAKVLPELFPAARFAMIYRDGRDVALSMQAFKPIRPAIWNWKWNRRFGSSPIDINDPAGRSRKLQRADQWFGFKPLIRWMVHHPPPLKDCAAFWSELTLTSLPVFRALPAERRHWIDYETLTREPELVLAELARFFGVEPHRDWLEKASSIPRPTAARWKKLDLAAQADLSAWTSQARKAAAAQLSD